jgi:hypothetical protein
MWSCTNVLPAITEVQCKEQIVSYAAAAHIYVVINIPASEDGVRHFVFNKKVLCC